MIAEETALTIADTMWATFQPRPDDVERYDEQTSFYHSRHRGVTFLLGGNGSGTTTLGLMKMVKLVLQDQEAPRPNTPFWIISEGYEMVCEACWAEKLNGRQMIPDCEIQWDKVEWYRPKQNWPFRVPLKPWVNGNPKNNWVLEFKSYEQGRSKMQARSIGGFLFVEQCPFTLITEVNRGCREYNFPGSKLAEFTPIDPKYSVELEEMIVEDRLPKGWAVYRCNTLCAKEAGHIDDAWFEEFFGMVSPEMLETRLTGAFASFDGLIYPGFQRKIHVLPEEEVEKMVSPNWGEHKRSLDWGSTHEHPMVCLWGCKIAGNWIIYDEYVSTDQHMTMEDHCEAIKEWRFFDIEHDNYHQTYGDPARPDLMRTFARHGMPVTSSNNAVMEGIETVRSYLKVRPNGSPGILISSKCKRLIKEFQIYRWHRSSENSLNPALAVPKPLKRDDDALDALRYLLYSDLTGRGGLDSNRIVSRFRSRFISSEPGGLNYLRNR